MQRQRALGSRQGGIALEDVQRLADGRAAAGGRRHAVDVEAAEADLGRPPQARLVVLEVAGVHQPGADRGGPGGQRRGADGVDDRARGAALVEALRALEGQPAVGVGQIGVALHGAHRPGGAGLGQVQRARGAEAVEARRVARRLRVEGGVDREAALGDADARAQRPAQRPRAVAVQRLVPARGGAGHADAQPGGHHVVERQRRAGGVDEAAWPKGGGGGLARVDRGHAAGGGAVDRHEAAAADAGGVGLGDAEHAGGDHGRVDRVGAAAQRVDGGSRGGRVDAGGGAAGADRGRALGRLGRRPLLGERDRRGQDGAQRHDGAQGGGETTTTHPGLLRLVLARRVRDAGARRARRAQERTSRL